MAHEKLTALIERAKKEDKILYCPGNGHYYDPQEIEAYNKQGKLLWAVEHFELRTYDDYHNSESGIKKAPKGVLYFSVAECGTVRVFASNISFWYYDKKALQSMIHLKQGDCLRVEENIETVDSKIMESKEPLIGRELAKFWEEVLIERYSYLNENERA